MSDVAVKQRNMEAGHTLCRRCEGTGNQLFSMFQCCEDCGGSGIAVRYGELTFFGKWLAVRREVRELKRHAVPKDWNAAIRWRLSRWFGIGEWFGGRDRCWRCGVDPFDVEFEVRRVRPFRTECLDRESCDLEASQ